MPRSPAAFLSVLLASACSAQTPEQNTACSMDALPYICEALNHPERTPGDLKNDARRKPVETLSFAGLQPGMVVLELEAGRGYYSEILSRAVGPEGEVIAVNPSVLAPFFKDDLVKRIRSRNLRNIRVDSSNFDAFEAEPNSVDLATWIQGPHEIWFEPQPGVTSGNPDAAFRRIFASLKPGSSLIVIDHDAPVGFGVSAGQSLHRIEESIVVDHALRAGFVLDAEADFLARPDDDPTKPSFNRAVRGKTSQFVLRFTKPQQAGDLNEDPS
ncbi:MAG: methyltransferase [Pseudomonadota bacterium]